MFKFSWLLSILLLVCLTNISQTLGNKKEGSNQPLILVSTVDGKVSALEVKEGKVLWSNNFGSTPLVSSSLTPLYYNQDGKDIEIVPSLNGGLFKLQGESLQQIPFNADDMLEKSHQLTATSQLVGGKEYSSLGIDAATGRMLYNCSASGCNQTKGGSKVYGDVIVVKRNQLTIRLVETRSGSEKWNFKVGEVNLDFSKGLEKSLIGYQPQGYQVDPRASFDNKKEDYWCGEEGKSWRREDKERIKFSLTDRTVMLLSATDKSSFEWKRKFDSHITSAWVLVQGMLVNLDLFSPLTSPVPTTDQPAPLISNQFSIFHGHFFGQSFVQLSTGMKEVFRISASNQQQQVSSSTGLVEYAPQPLKIYTKSGRPSKSTITNEWLQNAMDAVDEADSDQDESSNTQVQIYDNPKFTEDRFFFGDLSECSKIVDGGKNDQQQQQPASDEQAPSDRRDPSDVGRNLNSSSVGDEMEENDNTLFEFLRSVFTFPQFICTLAATLALVYKIYPRVVDMFLRLVSDKNEEAGNSTGTGDGSSSGAMRNEATAVIGKTSMFVDGAVGGGDKSKATDECHQINEKDFESRFLHDFEVLECLGKGGFGVVFKARNKMDNCEYAVKRILLPESKRAREKMLREVRALAKIGHHPSIVRYFTCWEESPPSGWQEEKDEQLKAQLNWQVSSCDGEEEDETYTNTTTTNQQQSSSIVYRRQSSIQSQLKLRIPVSASSATASGAGGDFSLRIETDSELSPTTPNIVPLMIPPYSHDSNLSWDANPVGFSDDGEDSTSSESDATTKRRWSRYDEDSSSMGIIFDSKAYDVEQQLPNVLQGDKDDDIEIFSRQKSSTTSGSTDENWKGMRKRSQSECRTWTRNDEKSHRLQLPTVEDKSTTTSVKKKGHRRTSSYNQVLSHVTSQAKERRHRRRRNRNSSTCSTTQVYLYIQMQLCKRESLRDWLETNNRHRDHTQCLTIFKQVTDAVAFIHGNNLIHRDLKPSNVFISFEGEVRVGDFGLVTHSKDGNKLLDVSFTPLRRQSTVAMTTTSRGGGGVAGLTHTQQVGTQLYMAPEQMTSKRYSDKVDIFALGLILFELSHAFDTQMERIKLLNEARYGKYPSNFTDNFPHEAELVEAMLHIDEHRRPSAVQIQACDLLTNLK